MDTILERCFVSWCTYEVDFNDYAFGVSLLSAGRCPKCDRATIVFCPGCQRAVLTRQYVQDRLGCRYCDGKLQDLSRQRSIMLSDAQKRNKAQQSGARLQPRELAVLKLLAEGYSNKEVGNRLSLSTRTVDTYRARVMLKTEAHSVVELVHFAIAHELLSVSRIRARYLAH